MFHVNGLDQHALVCVWIVSLRITFSGFIHFIAAIFHVFLWPGDFLLRRLSLHHVLISWSVVSTGSFAPSEHHTKAAMKIMCKFLCRYIYMYFSFLSGYTGRSRVVGHR